MVGALGIVSSKSDALLHLVNGPVHQIKRTFTMPAFVGLGSGQLTPGVLERG